MVEPKVRVELLSEVAAIAAGETFWLALRQDIAPGWHTYRMNPGDFGEPPRIEWALQAVAADQPVKTPVTRAYGCTVKYS
jgi:DsbC/DsbD-like thiol-disulfide interchange protein